MVLYQRLNHLAKSHGKYSYYDLLKLLNQKAAEGKFEVEIPDDEVLKNDIEELEKQGLKTKYHVGEDYDYYVISWE